MCLPLGGVPTFNLSSVLDKSSFSNFSTALNFFSLVGLLALVGASSLLSFHQTCQLALDLIAWRRKQGTSAAVPAGGSGKGGDANPYLSVDPAPSCGADGGREGSTPDEGPEAMGKRLRDKDRSLFERYRSVVNNKPQKHRGESPCCDGEKRWLRYKCILLIVCDSLC